MQKAPLSVRVIYLFSSFALFILILATIAAFGFNILLQIGEFGDKLDFDLALPTTFNVEEIGLIELGSKSVDVKIIEATGKMQIVDTPLHISKLIAALLFMVVGLALFMVWKFRMFIKNIKEGIIFSVDNIQNLKHVAYGLLSLFVISRIYETILYYTIAKDLEFTTVVFDGIREGHSGMLVGALFLWVLAHIFIKGVEMKEDQELTI